MRRVRAALVMLAMILGALGLGMAHAAGPACAAPSDLALPHVETAGRESPRDLPIGSYTLATFWMPEHCKRAIRGIAGVDCARPEVHGSGLMLHGLWPDGQGKDWPQWCKPADVLPAATIAAHYCATPSAQQLQHEWAKHGTCMAGTSPERYFERAEQLYRNIRIPDLRALSYKQPTVMGVKRAITDLNPGLRPDMFRLVLDQRGWLQEIWFCLDTNFRTQTCPGAKNGLAEDAKVLIWRGGRSGGAVRSYGDARNDRSRRYDRGSRPERARRSYG